DLHEAEPARSERFERVRRAEFRHLEAGDRRRAHDRRAFGNFHHRAVDRERNRALRPGGGCSPVYIVGKRRHDTKSCGKWLSALSTGYGTKPPRAHNDPAFMVSQRSRKRVMFAFTSCPPRILSITSCPRTAPIRHGVHFPQDSKAQNSIANLAWWAMSTLSLKTTTPPWPSRPSRSANAS